MKKIISISFIFFLVFMIGCQEQPYWDIPLDANGDVILTGVAKATSLGISTLDNALTVNGTFATAKPGDIMIAEMLKMQVPLTGGGTDLRLLPLVGTQKEITVDSDLKASVTYTRDEAQMNVPGDYVTVTFGGETDAVVLKVAMSIATTVSEPAYSGKEVTLMRIPDIASVSVAVKPKSYNYTGTVIVKRKNGFNDTWIDVGNYTTPASVPVSGADYAAGKDTMYYSYVAQHESYKDEIVKKIIVVKPSFFLLKTATLKINVPAESGRNLLNNAAVAETAATATLGLTVSGGSLVLKGGSTWLAAGKTIEFVRSTSAMYNSNNSANAIAAFAAGPVETSIDPSIAPSIFIFKIVDGAATYYGMIKVTGIVPGTSTTIEYRIGNEYAHRAVIS